MKILLCFGTRPEAIKLAPVVYELKRRNEDFKVCVTGQHREMLDQVLRFFEIKPDYDLHLMKDNQSLNNLSSAILNAFDEVLEKEKPDILLVQGDTTTAFIASLAAFNRKIKIGHIEAGLRTNNKSAPFPEEGNRQLISRISNFHFAPTENTIKNLVGEGISKSQIYLTGNTVVDALEHGKVILNSGYKSKQISKFEEELEPGKKLILVTGHRRENFGKKLEEICEALLEISARQDIQIIFPVHLNPAVDKVVRKKLAVQKNILLTSPVDYPTLLWLLMKCDLIISDSGGIQEEAPSFKKPLLVTREVSERMEGVKVGYSILTGTSRSKIITETLKLLDNFPDYSKSINPYGDGTAAQKIVEIITRENA